MMSLSSWTWRKFKPARPHLWRVTIRRASDNRARGFHSAEAA